MAKRISTKDRLYKELIEELLTIIANDDVGLTFDLIDIAFQAGLAAGLTKKEMDTILREA